MVSMATPPSEKFMAHLKGRLFQSMVPPHFHEGLQHYVAWRRPVGGCLTAILSNDLAQACGRIDVEYRDALFAIVFFLHNYAPATCWGSPDKVTAWLEDDEPVPENFD